MSDEVDHPPSARPVSCPVRHRPPRAYPHALPRTAYEHGRLRKLGSMHAAWYVVALHLARVLPE
jgi:hypothetical protein